MADRDGSSLPSGLCIHQHLFCRGSDVPSPQASKSKAPISSILVPMHGTKLAPFPRRRDRRPERKTDHLWVR